jgi:carboxyl-terminal processing protease
MPLRNLLLIAFASILSLVCYQKAERNRYSSILTEVMGVVEQNYVDPVGKRELFEHAMQGMINGLDPYSGYVPPEEYLAFRESIEQKFGGIGILVEMHPDTKRLTVMSPLFGTPAYEAGIKSGDLILAIDGHDTEGLELTDCVSLMRGDPDSPVKLKIQHRGEDKPTELSLVRTIIHTETVLGDKRLEGAEWDYHLQEDPRIAYLRITSFGDETAEEVRKALVDEQGKLRDFDALILDLRSNPGGTLYGAVDICRMFVKAGVIVSTRGRDGIEKQVYEADGHTLIPDSIPIAVLVNHYSASASEIVAACLQDHHRAIVIGERSWGKGTVQNVIELEGGKSALRLTTSSYWRPSNKNIHRKKDAKDTDDWGISPDEGFEVKLTDAQFEKLVESRAAKDVYRPYDAKAPTAPPTSEPVVEPKAETKPDEPATKEPTGEQPADEVKPATTEAAPAEPFDDPQLRKAIEYLQEKLKSQAEAASRA